MCVCMRARDGGDGAFTIVQTYPLVFRQPRVYIRILMYIYILIIIIIIIIITYLPLYTPPNIRIEEFLSAHRVRRSSI